MVHIRQDTKGWEVSSDIRVIAKPMPVPRAIGSRIDTAGWEKTCAGSVIDGMYVVILTR